MKILILRFSSIGDIVLTSPVMRCIKTQKPNYIIHYATKLQFEPLLSHNPYIDKIFFLNKDLNALIKLLKTEQYDLIVDLHKNIRSRMVRSALRVDTWSYEKINWEKWLMVKFKINILPYKHIVDRYLETIEGLDVHNDGKGLDYFIPSETNIEPYKLPNKYHVYALGAQHGTKKLPLAKQLEMLKHIQLPIVLIGGLKDVSAGEALASKYGDAIDLCGKLSINESAKVIQGAEIVFTHDTGMMHIAAALQKPIVSIWGNTIPEFGMNPYYGKANKVKSKVMEVEDLSCRPCSKIGYETCPKGHFKCMNWIDFSELESSDLS